MGTGESLTASERVQRLQTALHSLMVDPPAGSPQQGRDPTIAIATKPTGQGDDGPRQGILVGSSNASMALGGPGLAEHSTSPAFRDTQRLTDMRRPLPATRRA